MSQMERMSPLSPVPYKDSSGLCCLPGYFPLSGIACLTLSTAHAIPQQASPKPQLSSLIMPSQQSQLSSAPGTVLVVCCHIVQEHLSHLLQLLSLHNNQHTVAGTIWFMQTWVPATEWSPVNIHTSSDDPLLPTLWCQGTNFLATMLPELHRYRNIKAQHYSRTKHYIAIKGCYGVQ